MCPSEMFLLVKSRGTLSKTQKIQSEWRLNPMCVKSFTQLRISLKKKSRQKFQLWRYRGRENEFFSRSQKTGGLLKIFLKKKIRSMRSSQL